MLRWPLVYSHARELSNFDYCDVTKDVEKFEAYDFGITKHLRGIPNAWHFQFKVRFCVYGEWFWLGGSVAHTLMRR